MTAPDLAARAKEMETALRDLRCSIHIVHRAEAADLIRDLRAELERLTKFEAEVIDETARFNRGWERRTEPYRLLEDEFEQMGWAWAHAGEIAEAEERAAAEISFYATALKRVARALSDEVGGDDERLHDRKDCPSDDTCQCVAVRLCDESVAEEVGPGCDEED